ncbi:hypothetical protein D3C80_1189980 [compost metagenome]
MIAVLLPVVEIDGLGNSIFLDRLTKCGFHQTLVHDGYKFTVHNKPRGVVNKHHQEHLLHRSAFAKGQIRAILQVRLPQLVAVALLKAPGGHARFGVHS